MGHSVLTKGLVILAALGSAALAEDRSLVFLYGPAGAETGKQAAAAHAARIYAWLQAGGTTVELRRPGMREGQEVLKFMQPPAVQQSVADAAGAGNMAKLDAFLDALEIGVSVAGRKPGSRFLIVSLELPESSDDLSHRLKQIAAECLSKKVQVLVWDLAAAPAKDLSSWKLLAEGSGGGIAREFQELEARLPAAAAPVAQVATAKPDRGAAPTGPVVYTGFWRGAPDSANRSGGANVGPMRGLLFTESPMASLRFVTQGGNASARIMVSQAVRKKSGEVVWQASKELTVKSAAGKLEERKRGSLCYARRVTLPAGEYVIESTVEDLQAEEKSTASSPLTATDSIPGLALSGALLVRKLDKKMDQFEGDDLIQYDGNAMIPMLNPTFPANQPFDLPVYFLIYPDMNGKKPEMRLDIIQNGQTVGGTELAFTDRLRVDSREGGGGSGAGGEQHHEFPYLAKLANAMLLAGNYEVRVTARQDRFTVTRSAPFRVVDSGR